MTLVVVLLLMPVFPSDAAGDVSGFGGPVYAFEFAQTADDLVAIFGGADDPERSRRLEQMDAGNRWDFLFMALYTLFGCLFGLAVREDGSRLGWPIAILAGLASMADLVETGTLLALSEELAEGGTVLTGLTYVSMVASFKFLAIGLSVILSGLYLARRPGMIWTVSGCIAVLAALVILPGTLLPAQFGYILGTAIGVGWIVMLAYAASRSLKGVSRSP